MPVGPAWLFSDPAESESDSASDVSSFNSPSYIEPIQPPRVSPEPIFFTNTTPDYSLTLNESGNWNSGNMSYNTRTGRVEFNGPAGLIAGALVALLSSSRSGDGEERQRRVEAENEARAAKRQQETAVREKQEAESQASAAREQQEAAEKQMKEAEERAAQVQQEKDEAEQRLNKETELRKLGIEPERTVTEEEFRRARQDVRYIAGKINVGVVGCQNEGKSTLVNSLRGMRHDAPGSAKVGESEETLKSEPYLDDQHPNFVWHDVPGAGTQNCTAWGYYFQQKLFAYDKLILVHTSMLKQMDLRILQVCKHREQECVVARSKADTHIRNCKRNNGYKTVGEARDNYISMVRAETRAKNEEAGKAQSLCPQYVDYIVSEMGISQLVKGDGPSDDPCEQVIDERAFLEKLGLMGN